MLSLSISILFILILNLKRLAILCVDFLDDSALTQRSGWANWRRLNWLSTRRAHFLNRYVRYSRRCTSYVFCPLGFAIVTPYLWCRSWFLLVPFACSTMKGGKSLVCVCSWVAFWTQILISRSSHIGWRNNDSQPTFHVISDGSSETYMSQNSSKPWIYYCSVITNAQSPKPLWNLQLPLGFCIILLGTRHCSRFRIPFTSWSWIPSHELGVGYCKKSISSLK